MQGLITALLEIGFAFGAGLYVALSPCLFPLLPLFLLRTLHTETSRRRSVLVTMTLVLGILTSLALFTLVLQALIGPFLITHTRQIQAVLGGILVVLGILTMSEKLRNKMGLGSLVLKSQPDAPTGFVSVYVIGLSYSLLAAPCTGTTTAAIVAILAAETNIILVWLLFGLISFGVSLPYLAIALASGEARTRLTMSMTNSVRKIEIFVGALIVIIGILLILPLYGFVVFF